MSDQNKGYNWLLPIFERLTTQFTPATAKYEDGTEVDVLTVRAEDIPKVMAAIQSHIDEHYIGKGEAQFNWICQPRECGAYNPYDARMCRVCGSQRPRLYTESEVEQRCIEARKDELTRIDHPYTPEYVKARLDQLSPNNKDTKS